ncbi:uncharacterized protein LOC113497427 [Trichoplusia ni]|uniref:Uncharacterized protein LOC113497427 n=1 Tax=Trichoplusia ni TaxID=7111 RepID=A0A7E5VWR3_TRINI|nr:uncharacterized protein LOC113497427 [Trichoplusia ni]
MALQKSKTIPKDAVELDELQATEYVWNLVSDWESLSDTWALRSASFVLGGLNALCGIMINSHYRNKLKLGSYGFFASALPITIMPGILTAMFHRHLVSTELLLMKNEACPMCYEIRSGAVQLSMGLAYPLILAPASSLMLAQRYSTYRVPDLRLGPRTIFQFVRKLTRPYNNTLTVMAVAQLVTSSVLTYYEMRNNITLRIKMMDIEAKLMAEKHDS